VWTTFPFDGNPFTQAKLDAASFPLLGGPPLTVQATRRTITIEEVIAATGVRSPDAAAAQKQWTLGTMLLVGADETEAEVAAHQVLFDPIAASFAPAFSEATDGRGTLEVISIPAPVDMGGSGDAGEVATVDEGGCSYAKRGAARPGPAQASW